MPTASTLQCSLPPCLLDPWHPEMSGAIIAMEMALKHLSFAFRLWGRYIFLDSAD